MYFRASTTSELLVAPPKAEFECDCARARASANARRPWRLRPMPSPYPSEIDWAADAAEIEWNE
jgi:hypothetical protein